MEVSSNALFSYLLDDLYGLGKSPERDLLDRSSVNDFWPDASPDGVARLRLARSFFKKLKDVTSADADSRCLEKFLARNTACRDWTLSPVNAKEEELVGLVKIEIDNFFHPGGEPLVRSWFDIFGRARTGPGASLGANGVDLYTKLFSSRLTATSSEIYSSYIEYIAWFPNWCDAELQRLIAFGLPRYTSSSRLSFVRKTRDISRSICTEPSLNMFVQLGLGAILTDRLKSYFGIDLEDQPVKNRELARSGSLGSLVSTIDLEGASDSVSLGLCEALLPTWVFEILVAMRSRSTILPDGTSVPLWMVSSMGNGFTFPLQTIIFAAVVRAVHRYHSVSDEGAFGVFGDDIVCHSSCYRHVCRLLNLLGFVVNSEKSYHVGPFRESCGADFFRGVDVRGVYCKTLLSPQARYVVINRLTEWSARTGIPLPRTVGYLRDSVKDLAVPPHSSPDSGIRYPISLIHSRGMYSAKKQRYLYRCFEPFVPMCMVDASGADLVRGRSKNRRRIGNPSGLLVSAIGGYVMSRGVGIAIPLALKQGETPRYRSRWRVSPFWGPSIEQVTSQSPGFWQRWESATQDLFDSES